VIQGLEEIDLKDKRVFVRADFNVPLDSQGAIADDSRILATLPTIEYAIEQGARLILASHLGRPQGKPNPKFSLLPVAERLSELLRQDVLFPEDCISHAVRKLASELKEGGVILLENLRFHPEEEANDPIFCEKLAANADVYINDAFGTLHRAHASTVGMVPLVPEKGVGKLIQKEVESLEQLMGSPKRPFVAVLGGAKVSDKLGVIENLFKKVDGFLIGGAMAYTFLKAKGVEIGNSLVEEAKVHQAKKILERARVRDIPIFLPCDHVIAREVAENSEFKTSPGPQIPSGWMGVDIGPETLELFGKSIEKAKTILWNGPLGVFEISPFDQGTVGIAKKIAASSSTSLVGGGDSIAAVKKAQVVDGITHLSTGGGATLKFLEGKKMPGLVALENEV